MAEMKLIIGEPKTGKCKQIVLDNDQSKSMIGKKIGDSFKGELIDMTGYAFTITGGSDACGFPMRRDLNGSQRKKILAVKGVGIKSGRKGERKRKTVVGNTIFDRTAQINVVITKAGKSPLFEAQEAKAEVSAENKE